MESDLAPLEGMAAAVGAIADVEMKSSEEEEEEDEKVSSFSSPPIVISRGASIYDVRTPQRGSPKSRQKEQNHLICDSDKGGRGSKNPTAYMEAPQGM